MEIAEKENSYHDIEKLYSFLNILKIASNTDGFRLWLKGFHHLENDDDVFIGYQFFIDVILNHIIESIERNYSFGIEFDYTLDRAEFVGVYIDDIPITSEKTKLLKNIWNYYRNIRDCSNWNELKFQIEWKNNVVIPVFDEIFSSGIESSSEIPKDIVLRGKTQYYTLVFLNNTSRGRPHVYPGTILDSFITQDNYDKVFTGYLYTLQYLWSNLLSEIEFADTAASKLHEAIELSKLNKKPKEKFNFFSYQIDFAEQKVWDEWQELDHFYTPINDEIIKKNMPDSIRDSRLVLSENFDTSLLMPLMHLSKVSEPDYLIIQDSFESWTKMLDSFFFWHDMDLLDTNKIHVFNGAFAFISLLVGEVEKCRIFDDPSPVWIVRIKHPVQKNQNNFSYGILLQSGGLVTDTSGWLLFLDCGNDFSGSGGHLREQVEEFISKYEIEGNIIVKETSVSSDIFVKYLRQKNIPSLVQQIKVVTSEIIEQPDFCNEPISPESIVLHNLQNIDENDVAEISAQIEKIIFFLKIFIPNEPKYCSINEKMDQASSTEDIPTKLEIISSIVPLIPYIVGNNRMESIESKLDDMIVKTSPGPSSDIVISTGINLLGTGAKHEIKIPLSNISYDEISDDLKNLSHNPDGSLKNVPRLKKKIFNYLRK